jgi:uncharacterized protein (DUF2237 family)
MAPKAIRWSRAWSACRQVPEGGEELNSVRAAKVARFVVYPPVDTWCCTSAWWHSAKATGVRDGLDVAAAPPCLEPDLDRSFLPP